MVPTKVVELGQGVFEVGRVPPADLILNVPTVSSRHALLRIGTDQGGLGGGMDGWVGCGWKRGAMGG